MNRADQAPEPSIEELLASIRLIISDADKQAPFQKEPRAPGNAGWGGPGRGAPSEVYADEVFDLTDELVFPEETGRPQPAPPRAGMRGQPGFDGYSGPQAHLGARRGAALPPRMAHRRCCEAGQARSAWTPPGIASGGPETRTSRRCPRLFGPAPSCPRMRLSLR